jgi:hypothetical protein
MRIAVPASDCAGREWADFKAARALALDHDLAVSKAQFDLANVSARAVNSN